MLTCMCEWLTDHSQIPLNKQPTEFTASNSVTIINSSELSRLSKENTTLYRVDSSCFLLLATLRH